MRALLIAGLTLLHILVFVYWLGGDLGVFYASTILTDTKTSPQGRIIAAKVLAQVDMAARTAMIFALPTGLSLAHTKGWISIPPSILFALWLFSLTWLVLAWVLHLKHAPPTALIRKIDLVIRFGLTGALLSSTFWANLPLFIALKVLILATTIVLGLLIRRALAPFGPAFGQMVALGPTPETDAIISKSLAQSRPAVLAIWVLLLLAAFLGIVQPTS
jgi:hypothetical protein